MYSEVYLRDRLLVLDLVERVSQLGMVVQWRGHVGVVKALRRSKRQGGRRSVVRLWSQVLQARTCCFEPEAIRVVRRQCCGQIVASLGLEVVKVLTISRYGDYGDEGSFLVLGGPSFRNVTLGYQCHTTTRPPKGGTVILISPWRVHAGWLEVVKGSLQASKELPHGTDNISQIEIPPATRAEFE